MEARAEAWATSRDILVASEVPLVTSSATSRSYSNCVLRSLPPGTSRPSPSPPRRQLTKQTLVVLASRRTQLDILGSTSLALHDPLPPCLFHVCCETLNQSSDILLIIYCEHLRLELVFSSYAYRLHHHQNQQRSSGYPQLSRDETSHSFAPGQRYRFNSAEPTLHLRQPWRCLRHSPRCTLPRFQDITGEAFVAMYPTRVDSLPMRSAKRTPVSTFAICRCEGLAPTTLQCSRFEGAPLPPRSRPTCRQTCMSTRGMFTLPCIS